MLTGILTVRIIYSLVLGSCPETRVGVLVQSAVQARLTTQLWDVVHRYEVLLEPHTPHCPVQPPGWGKWSFTAKRDSYRQRAYVWIPLPSLIAGAYRLRRHAS